MLVQLGDASINPARKEDSQVRRAARCEYKRRGCPLTVCGWDISHVSFFMKQYLKDKEIDSDHGVHASMFDTSTYPSPMPAWIQIEQQKS